MPTGAPLFAPGDAHPDMCAASCRPRTRFTHHTRIARTWCRLAHAHSFVLGGDMTPATRHRTPAHPEWRRSGPLDPVLLGVADTTPSPAQEPVAPLDPVLIGVGDVAAPLDIAARAGHTAAPSSPGRHRAFQSETAPQTTSPEPQQGRHSRPAPAVHQSESSATTGGTESAPATPASAGLTGINHTRRLARQGTPMRARQRMVVKPDRAADDAIRRAPQLPTAGRRNPARRASPGPTYGAVAWQLNP